jgi:hexosaminidase
MGKSFIIVLGIAFLLVAGGLMNCSEQVNAAVDLIPLPEKIAYQSGSFRVTPEFTAAVDADPAVLSTTKTTRTQKALRRMLNRLAGRTGIFFNNNAITVKPKPGTPLTVSFKRVGELKLYEDESYHLRIDSKGIRLTAETDIGILRGLETLLQLLNTGKDGCYFPAVRIDDKPRFAWRGLLIDPCRHWMPVGVIKRNLDGMAAVKMNVMHWHITEDQGFRIECKTFPKLHQMGSDGFYYTHEQVKDVIAYAADRGIRVMPEFDIPGHSTSWLVGYPELGSAPGPYSIEREYGIKDPTFNPTIDATYQFFDKFFKEMTALFPDEYVHIGGDENNGKHWDANEGIQAFKEKNNIKDNHELQAYFNRKILAILSKYNKKMVGWDEIFQPGIPDTIVIQSWRGQEALRESAKQGYRGILSNGYYIDLCQTAAFHYLNDPIPADSGLTDEQKKRVLGGEATMWAELISPDTIDSRIWPRTAAIAERFWSPASVRDVDDMYRRLDIIGLQLEELGLNHWKYQAMFLRRLTGGRDTTALKVLVDVAEPLKVYNRHRQTTYTFYSPLTRFVDAALPESMKARAFRKLVETFIKNPTKETATLLLTDLHTWKTNHARLKPVIDASPILKEIESMSQDLSTIAAIGIKAVNMRLENKKPGGQWLEQSQKTLEAAKAPRGHAELMIIPGIQELLKTHANPPQ